MFRGEKKEYSVVHLFYGFGNFAKFWSFFHWPIFVFRRNEYLCSLTFNGKQIYRKNCEAFIVVLFNIHSFKWTKNCDRDNDWARTLLTHILIHFIVYGKKLCEVHGNWMAMDKHFSTRCNCKNDVCIRNNSK